MGDLDKNNCNEQLVKEKNGKKGIKDNKYRQFFQGIYLCGCSGEMRE